MVGSLGRKRGGQELLGLVIGDSSASAKANFMRCAEVPTGTAISRIDLKCRSTLAGLTEFPLA